MTFVTADTIIENENDALKAGAELYDKGANAAVVYLGNFGPEGPTSTFIKRFHGPVMACAAAEESSDDLVNGRGDAFCGMLNLSYNIALKNLNVHIPENPVGLPENLCSEMEHFEKVAKIYIGIKNLKVFSFGPRPQDFYACNAPIKPLYNIGVELMENSELDLLEHYKASENNSDIDDIAQDMAAELGEGNTYPDLLKKLAQFESALLSFKEENIGARDYAVFADKCWPAFEAAFGFVPCFINSRLASKGIPVSCEVDIYGAVSEYMAQLASDYPATILDINNTVPKDMAENSNLKNFTPSDLFMGFHCGNTPSCCLCGGCSMKYQLIMNRLMEDGNKPDITRGTLEGTLIPGEMTMFRLQSTADSQIRSYIADGEILDIDPKSFGSIAVIAVKNLSRFYRHVLIGGNYPHHTAIAFRKSGSVLFDAVKLISGITPSTPKNSEQLYPEENPFK